jgi:omega-6 fatty acid desaturase (delta-12 desaturase)
VFRRRKRPHLPRNGAQHRLPGGGEGLTRRQLVERIRPIRPAGNLRSASLLAIDLAVYAALWTTLLFVESWWAKFPLAFVTGVAIARLFLIGHDACHGSFFAARGWANAAVGRLVFLPSLTPCSTWELGHNTLHHGFTNLRGKDYVYTPFSKAHFDALPRRRQWTLGYYLDCCRRCKLFNYQTQQWTTFAGD